MHLPRRLSALAVAILFFACGDSTGLEPDDLAGTWIATSAIMTDPAGISPPVDLVTEGIDLTFIVGADGSLEAVITMGTITDTDTGSFTVDGDNVTVILDGDPSTGTISRSGNTLTMDLTTGIEWDFDGDNLDEPATLALVMVRSS